MNAEEAAVYKAYMQGYFAGYRDAHKDMENGISHLDIESDLLSQPIEAMALRVQTYNSLTRAGFRHVGDIISLSDSRIIAIRGLGAKGRREIACWLDKHSIPHTVWQAFFEYCVHLLNLTDFSYDIKSTHCQLSAIHYLLKIRLHLQADFRL